MTRIEKSQRFKAAFTFLIPPGKPHPDLEWRSLFQIHAADVRDTHGAPLIGSPLFSLEIAASSNSPTGELLVVRGETSIGDGTTWPTLREFAHIPFVRGIDHRAEIEVIDSHGGAGGMVRVAIDGKTIVNQSSIPTGYAFVDLPILLGGRPQDNRSYPKLGIYAGNSEQRPSPMVLETVIRDLTMSVER